MKKIIALLLCGLLALLPALAEEIEDNPFGFFGDELPGDGTEPRADLESDDSVTLDVGGERVRLAFDSSPQYSSIEGGMVQASYYAYGPDGVTLYELYISFPETARAGMVITPEYEAITRGDASVVLIVSNGSEETYFFSSLANGSVYPEGSDFSISIDSIEGGTYSGSFSATLIALDLVSGATADTLTISETPFRFTLDGGQEADPSATPKPTAPPDDMRKV